MSKVIHKNLTELFGLMSTSLILVVKSSGMVFFLFDANIDWIFLGFIIKWFALSQFMDVWDYSVSISVSELRSDEYADKVLASV